ncbi:hypothetical protein QD47_20685 [Paenibacillus terrae]|uniref:Uncharacterized protein n=1 Tax=Paenibacillus terrae TaxID=159743 RepID=A0A0D7X1B4_9BACL|nr:hypothetical protein QD47_20685 [Paenibacillus terrae]
MPHSKSNSLSMIFLCQNSLNEFDLLIGVPGKGKLGVKQASCFNLSQYNLHGCHFIQDRPAGYSQRWACKPCDFSNGCRKISKIKVWITTVEKLWRFLREGDVLANTIIFTIKSLLNPPKKTSNMCGI